MNLQIDCTVKTERDEVGAVEERRREEEVSVTMTVKNGERQIYKVGSINSIEPHINAISQKHVIICNATFETQLSNVMGFAEGEDGVDEGCKGFEELLRVFAVTIGVGVGEVE